MADDTILLRSKRQAAKADQPGPPVAPAEHAESAYDLAALLKALDARLGAHVAGAEALDDDAMREVSRVVRMAARAAVSLGNELADLSGTTA